MAEYRRFVAYVYEYQKGRKGTNCGFVRVEAREKECRMEVHLCCPGLVPQVRCEIFGFVRNAGLMDGSLLGSCMTGESRADCVIETERDNMGNSGVPLNAMGGMILVTENGAFFGTEWDDNPIRPDHFRRKEIAKNSSEKSCIQTAQSTEKKSENTRKAPDEGLKEQTERIESVIHKDMEKEVAEESNDCGKRESVVGGNMTREGERESNTCEEIGHIVAEEAKDSGEKGGSREELEHIVAEDAAKSLVRDQNSCIETECPQSNLVSGENAGTEGEHNDCEKMESSLPEDLVTDKDRKGAASDYIKEAAEKEKVETWKLDSEEETKETEKQEIRERNLTQEGEKSKNGQSNPKNKIDPLETESFDSASGKDNAVKMQAAQTYPSKESDMKVESIPETGRSINANLKSQNIKTSDFSRADERLADYGIIEQIYEENNAETKQKVSENISVTFKTDQERSVGQKPEFLETEYQNMQSERPSSSQKQQPKDPEHPQTPPTTQTTINTPPHLGTPYTPFADGEIYDCRKIHPNDFRFFLPRDCGLRNNRFLQYGFQNFGHLLLGRNRAGRCVLGVPGGYDQQERFMANMFGFSYFKESGQIRLPRSRGGYWYRLINPPKFY